MRGFRGERFFLSNYYVCKITYEGIDYSSVEAAFQAAKTLHVEKRMEIAEMSPDLAKKAGRRVELRPDWEEVKFSIMEELLRIKFSNPMLRDKLIATGDEELVEYNTWHDNIWGDCDCEKCANIPGQNNLGKLLMKIRSELKQ